jgi:hypothetical protein
MYKDELRLFGIPDIDDYCEVQTKDYHEQWADLDTKLQRNFITSYTQHLNFFLLGGGKIMIIMTL